MHGLIHGKASHKNKEPRRIVSGSVYCYVLRIHECEKITESLRSFPGIRSCFCASSESTYNSCIIIFIVCGSISGRIISIEWADFYSLSIVLNCIRKSSINRHTHCVYLFISIGWSHVDLYRPNDRYIQIARVNRYFFVSILWLNSFPPLCSRSRCLLLFFVHSFHSWTALSSICVRHCAVVIFLFPN